ncbi:hypothetical protein ACKKBF_B36870 [Auxenochlorella protothecoides x Auxenochlorella symbiontica]
MMANPRQTLREWGAEPVPPNGRLGPEYSLQPPRARGFQGLYDTPAGGLLGLWQRTLGTLTLDLKRQILPKDDTARPSLFRLRRQDPVGSGPRTYLGTPVRARRRGSSQFIIPQQQPGAEITFPEVAFDDSGARLKVMRHVQFGPAFYPLTRKVGAPDGAPSPCFDLGVGAQLEFDTAAVQAKARIKFQDWLSLKALPEPAIKLQKRFALGESGAGVRVSYECPLRALGTAWQPPARLLVSIDSAVPSGLRLTQGGVEFDQALALPGNRALIRGAGRLGLPSRLPLEEGEPWVEADVRRLGLKAVW